MQRPSGGSEVGCDSKARNVPMTAEGSRRSWGFPDIGSRKKGKRPHQGGAWTVGSDGVVCVCVCVCVCMQRQWGVQGQDRSRGGGQGRNGAGWTNRPFTLIKPGLSQTPLHRGEQW